MAQGCRIAKSSSGRWVPLFKVTRNPILAPPREAREVREAREANANAELPHAWNPGTFVLNGSGRPLVVKAGDQKETRELHCPWESPRVPPRPAQARAGEGILAKPGSKNVRPQALRFMDGLVSEMIAPPPNYLDSGRTDGSAGPTGSYQRCAKRKATGKWVDAAEAVQDQATGEEAGGEEAVQASEVASVTSVASGGSAASGTSGGSGFDSEDDEEKELNSLEELAAQNAKSNKEAMRLPLPPTGPGTQILPQLPVPGQAAPPRHDDRNSSFGSSLPADEPPLDCLPPAAEPLSVLPAVLPLAPLAALPNRGKRPNDDSSSFGSSDEGVDAVMMHNQRVAANEEHSRKASVDASPLLLPSVVPVPRPMVDSPRSSFASSDDG